MAIERGEVVERIGPAEFARVEQAHEDIPHVGAVVRLVEQRVPPMPDRLLQAKLSQKTESRKWGYSFETPRSPAQEQPIFPQSERAAKRRIKRNSG